MFEKRARGIFLKAKTNLTFPFFGNYIAPSIKILVGKKCCVHLANHVHIWEYGKILVLDGGKIELGENVCIERCGEISVAEGAQFSVGSGTGIGSLCNIRCEKEITIGKNCLISQFVTIVDGQYELTDRNTAIGKENYVRKSVAIGNNVWIGAQVVILPGVTLGDGAVIGAGSIVNKPIEAYSINCGNPVRKIKMRT